MSEQTAGAQTTSETPVKVRKPKTARPRLVLADLTASIISPEEVAKRRRTFKRDAKPRSAEQKAIDALVKQTHDKWVASGKKENWTEREGANVILPTPQLDTLKSAVYSAGTFLGLRVRFGTIVPVKKNGKDFSDVVFTVTDKPADDSKDAKK
jgi:hypothetical protein